MEKSLLFQFFFLCFRIFEKLKIAPQALSSVNPLMLCVHWWHTFERYEKGHTRDEEQKRSGIILLFRARTKSRQRENEFQDKFDRGNLSF